MILAHYSEQPIYKFDMAVFQPRGNSGDEAYRSYYKPRGMWVSVDDAEFNWQHWCIGEGFGLDRFRWRTEVILKDNANVLFLKSVPETEAFVEKYGYDYLATILSKTDRPFTRKDYLWWPRVMDTYDGIIINPYSNRYHFDGPLWYNGWDCSSGCIWNGEAVTLKASEPFDIDDYSKRIAASRDEEKEQIQSG